jgi:GTP-binding protein Era
MNAFIGERLSIVTPKAQTTWERITGILTTSTAQMIFLDTPGLLEPRDLLQRSMLSAALEALREADVALLVLDATAPLPERERGILASNLAECPSVPLLVAVNKMDVARPEIAEALSAWAEADLGGEVFHVSALKEEGITNVVNRLEELLPPGPFLYPPDDIARDPVRFFVAEIVRECVFESYYQEIPYSTFCRIEEFRENQDPIYIQAHLFVERNSQKRILIGKGGSSIRTLGSNARKKIEAFLGAPVYLDLWVKVLPDWRRRRVHLKRLGFPVPEENEAHA